MAFRLKHDEAVSHGIRRLARKALRGTIDRLQPGRPAARDEAVHDGRKNIKKTRALLDLLRNALGHTYGRDKQQLRQAARPLSQERDAKILLDTFDELRQRYRTTLRPGAWRLVRRALEEAAAQTTYRALRGGSIPRTLNKLAGVHDDSRSWSCDARGFRALAPGLKRSFTRARKAWRHALKEQTPANLHRWRKRVKTHWYQTRLVESSEPRRLHLYLSKLHRLETCLGDYHNLIVLSARIKRAPMPTTLHEDIGRLSALIERRKKRLQNKALVLGGRIYTERGHVFVNRLERFWDRWRTAE